MDVHIIRLVPDVRKTKKAHLFISPLCILAVLCLLIQGATAVTTSIHVQKVDADGTSILAEKTIDYLWMEQYLPVAGDGVTHYYHQGPVFTDNPDPATEEQLRWNPAEDKNVQEKDMGALKGTRLQDITDLAGGMKPGDTVLVRASDGFTRTFGYENVYHPPSRQGPIVITWYRAGEGYVPNYTTGMRLVFFADNSTNPWGIHAFGNQDWHESASPGYWYYYIQGNERYPTTTGLSVQSVSEITIYPGNTSVRSASGATGSVAGLSPLTLLVPFGLLVLISGWRGNRG
ncbi:MAG: argininosuccinate synthase [Methanoregulaceae archaeon]|nr:argininosuccinate synthase [Methanoregulaceae archaeon]